MDATGQVLLLIPFTMRTVRLTEIKSLAQDRSQDGAVSLASQQKTLLGQTLVKFDYLTNMNCDLSICSGRLGFPISFLAEVPLANASHSLRLKGGKRFLSCGRDLQGDLWSRHVGGGHSPARTLG